MADAKGSTQEIERWQDWEWDCYQGTKDALIAAGIKAEWFPSALVPELRKDGSPRLAHHGKASGKTRTKRTYEFPGGTIRHSIDKHGTEIWTVRVAVSAAEAKRREEEARRRWNGEDYETVRKELADMPQSHEAYRERALGRWESFFEDAVAQHFGAKKYHGYSFAKEVLDEIDRRMGEIRGILETGRIVFSRERHEARIAELRSKVAGADPAFASFINRLTK
jgi:hypothetical protein